VRPAPSGSYPRSVSQLAPRRLRTPAHADAARACRRFAARRTRLPAAGSVAALRVHPGAAPRARGALLRRRSGLHRKGHASPVRAHLRHAAERSRSPLPRRGAHLDPQALAAAAGAGRARRGGGRAGRGRRGVRGRGRVRRRRSAAGGGGEEEEEQDRGLRERRHAGFGAGAGTHTGRISGAPARQNGHLLSGRRTATGAGPRTADEAPGGTLSTTSAASPRRRFPRRRTSPSRSSVGP
jgi:hypothetical protein